MFIGIVALNISSTYAAVIETDSKSNSTVTTNGTNTTTVKTGSTTRFQ